jgi:hypothetical protein
MDTPGFGSRIRVGISLSDSGIAVRNSLLIVFELATAKGITACELTRS